jgi:Dyp-type peroxidase family
MAQAIEVDYGDIQGLARFGHGRLKEACYLLVRIADREAARAWLRAAPVTTAVTMSTPPPTALQLAFTSQGLAALGLSDAVIAQFSDELRTGMAVGPNRSRRLGDLGDNAPVAWQWGGSEASTPHVLVMLFAKQGKLAAWETKVTGRNWDRAFELVARLDTVDIGPIEPFGFADGVSQPEIDWNCALTLEGRDQFDFRNTLALGEVLLGYRNEYGLFTERPLLDPAFDAAAESLPESLEASNRRDLGRNGSYLVFRQLEQDVARFWRYVDEQAGHDEHRRQTLADAMVGRRRDGTPLVPTTSKLIDGIGSNLREQESNGFLYEDDPDGTRCPFGAHIRRANPRTGDLPGGVKPLWRRLLRMLGFKRQGFRDDMVASTRFHRLVRRGRTYGSPISPEAALALEPSPEPDARRGIHFICLNANIQRQFEFVQNAWMVNAKFDGLADESDPLTGNREPLHGGGRTDRFSLPRADGPPQRLDRLPRFVTVRGGAYFFMPGMRALRYITEPQP